MSVYCNSASPHAYLCLIPKLWGTDFLPEKFIIVESLGRAWYIPLGENISFSGNQGVYKGVGEEQREVKLDKTECLVITRLQTGILKYIAFF